jgi:SAM-dependent methyltransferase
VNINNSFLAGGDPLHSTDPGPCRICGHPGGHETFIAREMMFGTGTEYSYFQCASCGCLQIRDIPEDISSLYPKDYYSFGSESGLRAKLGRRLLKLRDDHAYSGHGMIGRMVYAFSPSTSLRYVRDLELPKNSRILDVGSGEGRFLRVLSRHGYSDLTGIDPFLPADRNDHPGLKILKKTLDETEGPFDLIMLHHSLEHMVGQRTTFMSIARLLAPNGLALIRVPTVSSYAWERYGVNWVGLDAPRHFFLHSIQSLKYLADQARLSTKNLTYDSTGFQFWASDQYERGISLNSKRSLLKNPARMLLEYSRLRKLERLASKMNEAGKGDQIALLLAKAGGNS